MQRKLPAALEFQNERQRNGHWLAATQDLGEGQRQRRLGACRSDAGRPGRAAQLQPEQLATTPPTCTRRVEANFDKQLYWYFDSAETINDGNAHYDIGAGGRGSRPTVMTAPPHVHRLQQCGSHDLGRLPSDRGFDGSELQVLNARAAVDSECRGGAGAQLRPQAAFGKIQQSGVTSCDQWANVLEDSDHRCRRDWRLRRDPACARRRGGDLHRARRESGGAA